MLEDAKVWRDVSDKFADIEQKVSSLTDLKTAFGYVSYKAGADQDYSAVNQTLTNLAKGATKAFDDIETVLTTVIAAYEGAEEYAMWEVDGVSIEDIKKDWKF